jgi:hypothetical protein
MVGTSLFLVVLLFLFLHQLGSVSGDSDIDPIGSFGVVLTTIPTRFKNIHESLLSWFLQEEQPKHVIVFVPNEYARFKRKDKGKDRERDSQSHSHKDRLESLLSVHFKPYLDSGVLRVMSVKKDVGPVTKFYGLLENYSELASIGVEYWVVCDDDVRYETNTLSRYAYALAFSKVAPDVGHIPPVAIITHFSEDIRVFVRLRGEERARAITHVQGVDTFMVPNEVLREHSSANGALSARNFKQMLTFFHRICPGTFFQDDYLLSFAFDIASLPVKSIWNNEKVAGHITGLSKDFGQMHMHPQVHERETETKECIVLNADAAATVLTLGRRTPLSGAVPVPVPVPAPDEAGETGESEL